MNSPIKNEAKQGKVEVTCTLKMEIGDKSKSKTVLMVDYDKDLEEDVEYVKEFKKGAEMIIIGGKAIEVEGNHLF